ncbi:MAG: hypothetical protein GY711_08635 [bacterium]|nr:hypothetical protein [bacterium]
MASNPPFRLRSLPAGMRLALTLLICVCAGGYAASGAHMIEHHQNRDEREGLSLVDLEGAYHGVTNRALLITAIERGHPDGLADADKDLLMRWLESDRISEDYDNLDLGDEAPAEVLAIACLSCHSARGDEATRAEPYLDYWDEVKAVAFSRDISPTDLKILIASTHTHAVALFTTTLVLCGLMFLTGFASALRSLLAIGASAGLALDIAAWWLARESASLVYAVVAGGALHAGCMGLMMIAVVWELWLTRRPAED